MNYIGIGVHKSICTAVVMNDDEKVLDQLNFGEGKIISYLYKVAFLPIGKGHRELFGWH